MHVCLGEFFTVEFEVPCRNPAGPFRVNVYLFIHLFICLFIHLFIEGFGECRSLRRLEIPASVEEIDSSAFMECSGLTEVIFATDSRLRKVNGFQ
jgi:hypothetical protein